MLWVSADPGCGKSVLAKYLIDSVLPSTATTCYFFFKDDFVGQESITTALCCILFQLFRAKPSLLSETVIEQFEIAGEEFTDSFSELWNILLLAAQNEEAGEIVCVLDAIDECKDKSQLIQKLHQLYSTETNFNLKFLVTSRPYREIRQVFQSLKALGSSFAHISGEDESEMDQISQEIGVFIEAKVQDIGDKLKLTNTEKEFLLERFRHTPNRTYLWVHLALDSIEREIKANNNITKNRMIEITSQLQLPTTLDEAYEEVLSRSSNPEQAKKLLQIVVAVARPLTLQEMNLALALDDSHQSYKSLDLTPEERFRDDIRDLCGLFITVIDSRIYLFHQTAKEFLVRKTLGSNPTEGSLNWKHSLQLQDSHRILADICIQHLLFTEFETHPLYKGGVVSEYIQRNVFLDYSATHWTTHLHGSQIEEAEIESILKLCDTSSKRCLTWFRIYWANIVSYISPGSGTSADFPEDITTLMVVSYLGFAKVVNFLLGSDDSIDINTKDGKHGRSALSWASGNGVAVVLKNLLKGPGWKGEVQGDSANNHQERDDSYTSLLRAAQEGHEAVVRLLIDNGADIESKDNYGHTPLARAAECGYEGVVSLLLDKDANMETRIKKNYMTPLLQAAQNGHEKVVRLLIDKGAKIEAKDTSSRTPLVWAAQEGHEAVARVLIANGADKEARDSKLRYTPVLWAIHNDHEAVFQLLIDRDDYTPLLWAARNGYKTELQLLLDKGANMEVKEDKNYRTALALATLNNDKSVVQILLNKGADTNTRDKNGRTPLSWATQKGYEAIVRLLVDSGADIETKDNDRYGYSPLLWAAQEGREEIVLFLLDKGADIEAKDDKNGRTALIWAAINERGTMTSLLLEKGADIEAKDNSGLTALVHAIDRGYQTVIRPLLAGGADIESRNTFGRTKLSRAAAKGDEKTVRWLIDNNADIEGRDNSDFTPLLWAAQEGREAIARLLVDLGVDIEVKDRRYYLSPLSWAARNGHETIVRLLLDKGADINTKDRNGDTPLLLATGKGNKAVAQLLIDRGAQT
ncbi:hypothetical protein TWF506_008971 [Arthrobotrys conoides]|uniref:NACHT domain-containing protein n=1 Tax=Arthrobotrys conoides TaxID=74498 RepID=A0AAN8RWR4_9PEZI